MLVADSLQQMHKEKLPLHQTIIADILRYFFYLLYNRFAFLYDFVAYIVSLGTWNEWVLSIKPYLNGKKILELGHGTGILSESLSFDGKNITGIDQSSQMGKIAKSRFIRSGLNYNFITAVAQKLPFRTKSFDQVVSTFPSEYIIDTKTLHEISRILVDEGEMVLLPYAWIKGNEWYRRFLAWLFRITGQAPDWSSEFNNSFSLTGFDVRVKRIILEKSDLPLILATKNKN